MNRFMLVTALGVLLAGLVSCSPPAKKLVVHYGDSYQSAHYQSQGRLFEKQQFFYLHPDYKKEFALLQQDIKRLSEHLKKRDNSRLAGFVPTSSYFTAGQARQIIDIVERDGDKDDMIRAGEQVLHSSVSQMLADLLVAVPQAQFSAKGVTLPAVEADRDLFFVFQSHSLYSARVEAQALHAADPDTLSINLSDRQGSRAVPFADEMQFEESRLLVSVLETMPKTR